MFTSDFEEEVFVTSIEKLKINSNAHNDNLQDITMTLQAAGVPSESIPNIGALELAAFYLTDKEDSNYALLLYLYIKARISEDTRIQTAAELVYDYIQEHSPETLQVLNEYVAMFKDKEQETDLF